MSYFTLNNTAGNIPEAQDFNLKQHLIQSFVPGSEALESSVFFSTQVCLVFV